MLGTHTDVLETCAKESELSVFGDGDEFFRG
jgi:hypothetical protein